MASLSPFVSAEERFFGEMRKLCCYFPDRDSVETVSRPLIVPRRLFAIIRREAPLIFYLCPFICGQVLAYELYALYDNYGAVYAGQALFMVVALSIALRRLPPSSYIAGILTMFIALYLPSLPGSQSGPQVLKLVSDLRFPSPGALEGIFEMPTPIDGVRQMHARCRAIALPWRNVVKIANGQKVVVQASFARIRLPFNPFTFDATQRRHGIGYSCKIILSTPGLKSKSVFMSHLRHRVRLSIVCRFGEGEVPGLFLSMVLGVRDTISPKTSHAFQATGLSHLLVVSGFHITLIFSTILLMFRTVVRRICTRQPDLSVLGLLISCSSALFFVAFVGIDGASLRAGVAAVIVVVARIFERGSGLLTSVLIAFFVLSVIWPGCYFEPGVQLTFAALLGIAYGLGIRTQHRWVKGIAVAILPSVMTLGLTILWFGILSPASFILNPILAAPISFFVTVGGLISLALMYSGIDSTGVGVSLILFLLEHLRDFVVSCAELPGVAFELEGFAQLVSGGIALLLPLGLWIERGLRVAIGYGVVRVLAEKTR